MQTNSHHTLRYVKAHLRLAGGVATAAIAGLLIGAATSAVGAESTKNESKSADLQTYPATGTSGDRGVGEVYREEQSVSAEAQQGVQRAPAPRTAGDRGVNQPWHLHGQEAYMGRLSRRGGEMGAVRGTSGDRGINRPYTLRSEATQVDVEELQAILDDIQDMYDESQEVLDTRQAMLERGRWNPAAGTSGDRGINRVYRPEQSGYYVPDYSADVYRAPPPRTSGDRGVTQIYRGERTYRERPAHERRGQRADLYGLDGFTLPEEQVELDEIAGQLDAIQARLDEQRGRVNQGPRTSGDRGTNMPQRAGDGGRSASEPRRYYPAPGTSGDRGMNRVRRDEMLARERRRLDREQRMLDRGQRTLDRLQRKLDRQVERYARSTTGDRGVTAAEPGRAPDVERTLERLFSQLDKDNDQMLSEKEAKRLKIVSRNFAELDDDGDGSVTMAEFANVIEESEAL